MQYRHQALFSTSVTREKSCREQGCYDAFILQSAQLGPGYLSWLNTIDSTKINYQLTSEMVDRVESDPKPSDFEGVLGLDTLLQALYSLPVFLCKAGIIGSHQSRALEYGQARLGEVCSAMMSLVNIKPHCCSSSIISILNHLL